MSIIAAILFFGAVMIIGLLVKRKTAPLTEKVPIQKKDVPVLKGIFVHPSHTWAEVVEPDLVNVGMDKFAKSMFGSINKIGVPEKGQTIHQGGKAWTLRKDGRQLTQVSPVSGEVVEVNQDLVGNPQLLEKKGADRTWMLKIKPSKLKRELQNLLHGNVLSRWNQAVKEQLVATLSMSQFPVLQEGGEIKPDLGDELTSEQWERVSKEFFG